MSKQSARLKSGGHIQRKDVINFTFNGKAMQGYAGDTLASALLANGVRVVGRSFKYHRPRGLFAAGQEEPNALITVGTGNHRDVNTRATAQMLYEGLEATSQNAWPSLNFDVGRLNDMASSLFPAGFYYKTFHELGQAGWMQFEPIIRRMAGLGPAPEPDDYDTSTYAQYNAHCDVLVVGAGPAGLMAARTAAKAGARVILADEQAEPGGSLRYEDPDRLVDGQAPQDWVEKQIERLTAQGVRVLRHTQCTGYFDHNFLTLCERLQDHLPTGDRDLEKPRQRLWKVRAGHVVLATGALERPIAFAGNDTPGVMLAGAMHRYIREFAVMPAQRIVIMTNNDSAYRLAFAAQDVGIEVAAIVDTRKLPEGESVDAAIAAGIRVLNGHGIVGVSGGNSVHGVSVSPMTGNKLHGATSTIECDGVAVSGGWNPTVHLFSQSRGKLQFDKARGMFLPDQSPQPVHSAGSSAGVDTLADCLTSGIEAGAAAARACGLDAVSVAQPSLSGAEPGTAITPIWSIPTERHPRKDKAFVDFQHDVTVADIGLALREGFESVEHLKRYTTNGMATDQGKTSNVLALGLMSELTGRPVERIGTTTFRPPYTPLSFGAIVGANRGDTFDPVRTTPMHEWHVRHQAEFEPVGQWMRAWYYPRPQETMHDAVNREVANVRAHAGILDASTLGKIDIQGPDAAQFLNLIYTNAWMKLGVGRCRYGVMLGEDGMIFDDGVTARLRENHYIMSTTSGGAARVLAWLEEWLQTEWPHLRVYCTSVTEQYATISLNGPKARAILSGLTDDIDLDNEAFPHMSVREGHVTGVPARVMRISFTGELAYEINVPARFGHAVWSAVHDAGAPQGLIPYGTEAMHVLRAEKGFIIVGQDTDGTAIPADMAMDRLVSKKKGDFIGARSMARTGIVEGDRKQFVGLLTVDPEIVPEEGAHLVNRMSKPPVAMEGHITSSYYSPNLGRSIALAMVKRGHERVGERILISHQDREIPAVITSSVFVDPDGEKLRA